MTSEDQSSFLRRMAAFATRVPELLRRVPETALLGVEVERYFEKTTDPFTLAIVGAMKVGKSTIINTLVGEDIAPVDVTETTATVNWMRHGTKDQASRFRVVWNAELGREPEEFGLTELEKWVGESQLAAQTRYLEFYSTAPFLKRIQVVDTPGGGSTIEGHESRLSGFLNERHEHATLHYGGAADCVVFVIKPVAKDSDAALMHAFESRTRLPGSAPHNSVGVLHMWESLRHENPYAEASRMAQTAAGQLRRYLADVIPVSGPLGRAAEDRPIEFWGEVGDFVRARTTGQIRDAVSGMDTDFPDESLRRRSGLPWSCFRVLVRIAAEQPEAEAIRDTVRMVAGIDRLRDMVEQRFVDRARVVRTVTLLRKVLHPCDEAVYRLRHVAASFEEQRDAGQVALKELEPFRMRLPAAYPYVQERIKAAAATLGRINAVSQELEVEVAGARRELDHLSRDFESVRLMDDQPDLFTELEMAELRALFGVHGDDFEKRLPYAPKSGPGGTRMALRERQAFWNHQAESSVGPRNIVALQAARRLRDLTDHAL